MQPGHSIVFSRPLYGGTDFLLERMLPDTVLLTVQERQPMALWQHKGAFALIDGDGEVILKTGL